ncbi:MAG: hypothetical protein ACYTEL_08220 [Planctomycetota bacterium]|jgi:hypothetical protein
MTESRDSKRKTGKVEREKANLDQRDLGTDKTDKEKACNSCRQIIDGKATVCQHCGQAQGFLRKHFGNAATIVSIVMVMLAVVQLVGAFKKNIDASKALRTAETAAQDANEALVRVISDSNSIAKFRNEISFYSLIAKASNDDRASFDALCKIAKTEDHRFQGNAYRTLREIVFELGLTALVQYRIKWKERHNLDPSKASLADFNNVFKQVIPAKHPSVLKTIWEQERFPKAEKLEMLYEVITKTKSIRTLHHACKLMNEEAKLDKNILAWEQYANWWKENRSNYGKIRTKN